MHKSKHKQNMFGEKKPKQNKTAQPEKKNTTKQNQMKQNQQKNPTMNKQKTPKPTLKLKRDRDGEPGFCKTCNVSCFRQILQLTCRNPF